MSDRATLLVDNGSLEPAATRRLRGLAEALARRIGEPVTPVSLLHSNAIPPAELDGVAAEIFEPAVARRIAAGTREFRVVPLFFGPSRALTDYLPDRIAHLKRATSSLAVAIAPHLFAADERRLARILADHVRAVGEGTKVVLVDHGSPVRAVTDVRDQLARQLQVELGPRARVVAASMERRPGPEYAFADPLLADVLASRGCDEGELTIAMQFLLPGRHAGDAGDVAEICRQAEARNPRLRTRRTRLVGEHPLLLEILEDRWRFVSRAG